MGVACVIVTTGQNWQLVRMKVTSENSINWLPRCPVCTIKSSEALMRTRSRRPVHSFGQEKDVHVRPAGRSLEKVDMSL